MNEIYLHALKLLRARDYTVARLREKLEVKFGAAPQEIIDELVRKQFLNDRRFAENYVANRKNQGEVVLRQELLARGVSGAITDEVLSGTDWPSLKEALAAKLDDWKLRPPLERRETARLFRALVRLGYDEESIWEEISHLHD